MIQYIGGGSTPTGKLQDIVFDAKAQGDYAKEQGDAAKEAAVNVNEAVQSANQAAENANAAANNANDKANLADEKASLAQEKIDTLNTLEMNMNQAITDAQTATENANIASTNAGNEAQYAKGQGDYAKSQGDYAKAQGDYAKQQGEAVQGLLDNGPVVSVNGKTGAVTLTAEDVGAATEDQIHTHENKDVLDSLSDENGQLNYKGQPVGSVVSVNNKTGAVTLSAADVGAETPTGAQEKADAALNEAKAYTDQKLTNLSNNDTVQGMQKEIANLNLQLEASQRVPNGYTFGSDFSNTFGMTIDYAKTTAIGALEVGTTTIPVQDVTGFAVGQEVTIYDDVNLERVTISAIDTTNKTLTVSALTKSYKDKANIARTMAVADTINKCLKFGGWSTQTTNTVTDATVVASAYDTSGNGGRRLVRLSNGWLVSVAFAGVEGTASAYHYFYISKDNGATWNQLCYLNNININMEYRNTIAIVAVGTKVYGIVGRYNNSYAAFYSFVIDATTQTNVNIDSTVTAIDPMQYNWGGCSISANSAGTELHAVWVSKNSTYSNSFNIRYAKGTINSDGSVNWGAVEQVTWMNTSSHENSAINPCIVVKDEIPYIFTSSPDTIFTVTGSNSGSAITVFKRDKSLPSTGGAVHSSWSFNIIYSTSISYIQSSPSACVDKNGRIWVAWYGRDSTDTSANNIRVSYSDDGGITWSTMTKLTSGNNYSQVQPSITVNKNNEVFILWYGPDSLDSYPDIRMIKYFSGSWGSISIVSAGTTNTKGYPSALVDPTLNFSLPLFIYQDIQNNKVGFYGTWTEGSTVPILENDIRFTVKDTDEVVAWTERDELAGFTINATLNGQAMTKTSVTGEDQFTATLPNVQPAELKLTMTRANTADDVKITKILGGVA
jgi:hypothetical protein